jgi:hypothetical protein
MQLPLLAHKLFLPLLPRRNTVFHILSIIHELFNDFNVAAFIAEAQLPHNDVNAKSLFIRLHTYFPHRE